MNEYFIHYYSDEYPHRTLIKPGIVVASCHNAALLVGASLFGQVAGVIKSRPTAGGACACSFPSLINQIQS